MIQNSWTRKFILLLLISIFFAVTIGLHILPLGSTDWMMVAEDPSNHLLGWLFYQASPWTWPIGHTSLELSPLGTSIGQTDSIPLFGYIFKIFRDWLPYPSQYFGLALWISYLTLGFSADFYFRKKLVNYSWKQWAAVAIVLCSPVFFGRLSNQTPHIALTYHGLILGMLAIWNFSKFEEISWKEIICFHFVVILSCFIHPFLWVILISFHLPMSLLYGVRQKKLNWMIPVSLTTILISLLSLRWNGILGQSGSLGSWGFGTFSSNILSLFDPNEMSRILPDLASNQGQIEGMAYLGLGVIFLGAVVLIQKLRSISNFKIRFSPSTLLWTWAAILALVSLSDKIYFGDFLVLDLSWLYDHFSFVTGPLRSSGRLIWPFFYLLTLSILTIFVKDESRQSKALLLVALALQIFDVLPLNPGPLATWTHTPPSQALLNSDFDNTDFIRFFPPVVEMERDLSECQAPPISYPDYLAIALVAAQREIPINSGKASRFPWQAISKECTDIRKIILGLENESPRTAFIFASQIHLPSGRFFCAARGGFQICRPKRALSR